MTLLPLDPDELLTTTRSVRKRLDLDRPVERPILEECLAIAQQAPTASNFQSWHFLIVTDPAKRQALADLYRQSANVTLSTPWYEAIHATFSGAGDSERNNVRQRVTTSSQYLAAHLQDVPVHVIPCISRHTDGLPYVARASWWASIIPAAWSFMLAARARGLGTVWTTLHLAYEQEAAEVLGIPYDEIMQVALIPLAYTKGTDFKPAPRKPLDSMVHWDEW